MGVVSITASRIGCNHHPGQASQVAADFPGTPAERQMARAGKQVLRQFVESDGDVRGIARRFGVRQHAVEVTVAREIGAQLPVVAMAMRRAA
jgi:hypothetical protein